MIEVSAMVESAVAGSVPLEFIDDPLAHPLARPGALGFHSSVLAVVPQFRCEPFLADCLDSLVRQTRPLDGVVVIDDASGSPPVEIVQQFPAATLLASGENVGPYRLSQQVIAATGYDAYLFQDSDDWSLPERLELLLAEAERTGAEQVGCQGYRLISAEAEVVPLTYPMDVNAVLEATPTKHRLMHPSSVITRDLVMRAGGYAMGLRFGGDSEFLHRSVHVGRIVNSPRFAYVVRNREHSLTSSPETGLESPERVAQRQAEAVRSAENAARVARGEPPDLTPTRSAPPAPLRHLTGPRLRGADGRPWPA
jgi:hypothetical protein